MCMVDGRTGGSPCLKRYQLLASVDIESHHSKGITLVDVGGHVSPRAQKREQLLCYFRSVVPTVRLASRTDNDVGVKKAAEQDWAVSRKESETEKGPSA